MVRGRLTLAEAAGADVADDGSGGGASSRDAAATDAAASVIGDDEAAPLCAVIEDVFACALYLDMAHFLRVLEVQLCRRIDRHTACRFHRLAAPRSLLYEDTFDFIVQTYYDADDTTVLRDYLSEEAFAEFERHAEWQRQRPTSNAAYAAKFGRRTERR